MIQNKDLLIEKSLRERTCGAWRRGQDGPAR